MKLCWNCQRIVIGIVGIVWQLDSDYNVNELMPAHCLTFPIMSALFHLQLSLAPALFPASLCWSRKKKRDNADCNPCKLKKLQTNLRNLTTWRRQETRETTFHTWLTWHRGVCVTRATRSHLYYASSEACQDLRQMPRPVQSPLCESLYE